MEKKKKSTLWFHLYVLAGEKPLCFYVCQVPLYEILRSVWWNYRVHLNVAEGLLGIFSLWRSGFGRETSAVHNVKVKWWSHCGAHKGAPPPHPPCSHPRPHPSPLLPQRTHKHREVRNRGELWKLEITRLSRATTTTSQECKTPRPVRKVKCSLFLRFFSLFLSLHFTFSPLHHCLSILCLFRTTD